MLRKISKSDIPPEVLEASFTLQSKGFESYIVGGCVRDLMLGRKPKDWDITTDATPEEIISLFPETFYENDFGTVGIVFENPSDETVKVIEATPYRIESEYSDKRRPDNVSFSKNIEDDLKRRDFTINAIAHDPHKGQTIDLFKGQEDLLSKVIRTVGSPSARFEEDGLRIMRAVRLFAELGFTIDEETEEVLLDKANLLEHISKERIRDEFTRIIMSENPMDGIKALQKYGLLPYVVPQLEKAIGIEQNQAHSYDVWTHLLKSLQHSADKQYPLHVRLSALFHDIAKPASRRFDEKKQDYSFHGHEVVGSRETKKILENLKFSKEMVTRVTKLVRWHMFFSDTEQITLSAVRRMINNVGQENIWDLMDVRICDRIGTGRPKEDPYRLRKYHAMIDEALHDPLSVKMLKIDGKGIMDVTREMPGPRIGNILHALLEEVLDDPKRNTKEYLEERALSLAKMADSELEKLGESGKDKKDDAEEIEVKKLRSKHRVS